MCWGLKLQLFSLWFKWSSPLEYKGFYTHHKVESLIILGVLTIWFRQWPLMVGSLLKVSLVFIGESPSKHPLTRWFPVSRGVLLTPLHKVLEGQTQIGTSELRVENRCEDWKTKTNPWNLVIQSEPRSKNPGSPTSMKYWLFNKDPSMYLCRILKWRFGMVKTWPFKGVVRDLQRSGIKRPLWIIPPFQKCCFCWDDDKPLRNKKWCFVNQPTKMVAGWTSRVTSKFRICTRKWMAGIRSVGSVVPGANLLF